MVKKIQNKRKIKELKEKNKELEDSWKRAMADYQNLKKRVEKEKIEFAKYANQRLLEKILPVYDSLIQAQKEFADHKGIDLIIKQLDKLLENEGVRKIKVDKSDRYNPEIMEAIDTVETQNNKKKDTIAEVIRDGFVYKEKILRPAEVRVYV